MTKGAQLGSELEIKGHWVRHAGRTHMVAVRGRMFTHAAIRFSIRDLQRERKGEREGERETEMRGRDEDGDKKTENAFVYITSPK